jgi:hypothetical protein
MKSDEVNQRKRTLVSNWNFDASITRQSLCELLAQRCITNLIANED